MFRREFTRVSRAPLFCIASAFAALAAVTTARAEEPSPGAQDGVEVLTRGPVHEAVMAPVLGNPTPNPVMPKKPPDPVEELPPDQKPAGDNVVWIPGYWAWDDAAAAYLWVSGVWRAAPPGKRWISGHWIEAAGGWQWVNGFWADAVGTEVRYLPPPPASLEVGPSTTAPDAESIYVPGCWVYYQTSYLWRPGFWHRAHAEWVWVCAHYVWTPVGYVFVEGYWDYALERRGLLFAPVRIAPAFRLRAGWHYRPAFVISFPVMIEALFVRTGYGCYYFGDYFAVGYSKIGFAPWFDHRIGRHAYDPLFAHYQWLHREDRNWEHDMRTQYANRLAGNAPRPPRTFSLQEQMIHKITTEQKITTPKKTFPTPDVGKAVRGATIATPLKKLNPAATKLNPIPDHKIVEERKSGQELHSLSQERGRAESKILQGGPPPLKPTDPLPGTRFQTPKTTIPAFRPSTTIQTPHVPSVPQHIQQPLPTHRPTPPVRVPGRPLHGPEFDED